MKAIFLGTFNPPHQGHVNCIKSVINSGIMDKLNIELIHIIPCWQNPNKAYVTSFDDRYKMCTLEFAGLDYYAVPDDIESEIKPTYTYQLLDHFHSGKDKYIGEDFYWIITVETYLELLEHKWKESERLLKENKFILLYNDYQEILDLKSKYWKNDFTNVSLVKLNDNTNIHSTDIRNNFWATSNHNEISKETEEYIVEHKLYK